MTPTEAICWRAQSQQDGCGQGSTTCSIWTSQAGGQEQTALRWELRCSDRQRSQIQSVSGKKKEPKPKLFGPDFFRWGRGLRREGVGAKKFGMSFETQETQLFGQDIPGFCRDIPGFADEKFEKKKVWVQFLPLLSGKKNNLISRCPSTVSRTV